MEAFPIRNVKPVDSLAATLFVNSDDPSARLMAMFTTYFAASGDGRSQPFVVVSGFVANLQQWQMFERVWKESHDEAGVDLPFHMTEFMSACTNPKYANQNNARADYVRLANDPKAARLFFDRLAITAISAVHCGISCIVPMDIYHNVSSLLDLREVVPPYALAARMCIEKLHQWEQLFAIGESAEYIFEAGDFEQGKFTKLMIDEGQAVPIYKAKDDFAGLQAADLYAWEQFNALKKYAKPGFIPQDSASWLIWGIPRLHVSPTLETLINLCEKKGINPRTGGKK